MPEVRLDVVDDSKDRITHLVKAAGNRDRAAVLGLWTG